LDLLSSRVPWQDGQMRTITDAQRRARLATRHALARRVDTVEQVVEQMTCLHATEPASVYLSAFARSDTSRAGIEHALYTERSVVKQLAMRRTLFVFPRALLPAVWGSASARVAGQLRARLGKEVEVNGLAADGEAWLRHVCGEVESCLRRHGPSTTAELREHVPALGLRLEMAPGKKWGGSIPVAPRVLSTLAAGGRVLRGLNAGDWHVSRPRWTLSEDWLGAPPAPQDAASGYRTLVERWLRTFGPGTEDDLVWWLGSTRTAVRRALSELGAVEVALSGGVGHVLPDDLDDAPEPEPWGALLPVLDPTTMGWKAREFYLAADDVPHLFDSNGNAGTTAWWRGRIVGCWVQDPDGVVQVHLRHDIGSEGRRALQEEAGRLSGWLDGHRVGTVYPSALMRSAR
jgi:hypothetical protein